MLAYVCRNSGATKYSIPPTTLGLCVVTLATCNLLSRSRLELSKVLMQRNPKANGEPVVVGGVRSSYFGALM